MKRLGFLLLLALSVSNTIFLQSETDRDLPRLKATQPSSWQIDATTHTVSAIHWNQAIRLPGASRRAKAQTFITNYGADLGVKAAAVSFSPLREQRDGAGNHHLKLAQHYQGVPVFDGHLSFHFNKDDHLQGISGVMLPDLVLDTSPTLTLPAAAERGQLWLQKHRQGATAEVVKNQLYVYQSGLVQGQSGTTTLVYYLELSNRQDIRDYLIIDAQSGQIIEHFDGICHLIDREVYLENLNNVIWQEGDNFPAELDGWQQKEVLHTEEFYNLFSRSFDHISFDDKDGKMHIVDQVSFIDCPNASWNGYSTNYCDFIGADDVVGHEWGHAYTEFTSNLLLAWQAGAINEAYSDIWGETIDLLNGDEGSEILRTDCNNSIRWKLAEATGTLDEPLRDLYEPNCHGDPGKLSDPEYDCSSNDHGGIHTNAGVIVHAYALLVDGGSYNGYNISGIGLTKAAHVFWQTQKHYLSRTSDFKDMANGLQAALADLRGSNLLSLSLADAPALPSGEIIDATDSLALAQVLAATEMRLNINPCAQYQTALQQFPEDYCNEFGRTFYPFYLENFEQSADDWTISAVPSNPGSWVERNWSQKGQLPNGRSGKGMYAPNANVGNCVNELNNGILRLESPLIIVPDELEGEVYLNFDHYFSIENGIDGGNLKVQQDGGNWIKIPPSAFLYNGYNTSLPSASNSNNPMANERVFSGADAGAVTGTWGTTQIALDIMGVREGDEIKIRWELGTDGCGGWDGWYIDNIRVGTCASAPLLPVEWLAFEVEKVTAGAALHWTTAREENNAGFYLERSTDGRNFEQITWIDGQGYSEDKVDYHFLDDKLPTGHALLYYRLQQVDESGDTEYSPLRELRIAQSNSWQVFPNPAVDQLAVKWQGLRPSELRLILLDLQGKAVIGPRVYDEQAALRLDVSRLPAGVYLLQIVAAEEISTKRVVVE